LQPELHAASPASAVTTLNRRNQQIQSADFNARQDAPENWLPIVRHQLAKPADSPSRDKASTAGA